MNVKAKFHRVNLILFAQQHIRVKFVFFAKLFKNENVEAWVELTEVFISASKFSYQSILP